MSARSGCESTEAQRRLRVLVVEDDPLVRRRIREQLHLGDVQVVGEAHNEHALRAARDYRPDVILLGTLTADLARRLRELPEVPIGMRPVKSALTTREWEVLDQLCLGRSTSDIAQALALSIETVRTHVKNLMRKLKVHSRREAIDAAQRLRAGESVPTAGAQGRAAGAPDSAEHAIAAKG